MIVKLHYRGVILKCVRIRCIEGALQRQIESAESGQVWVNV